MAFQLSAGVNVSEIDLTTVVPSVATSTGALGGVFRWGPVGQLMLIDSEQTLYQTFGKPTSFNAETFFTGANFLSYTNSLYVSRAANTSGATPVVSVAATSGNNVLLIANTTGLTTGMYVTQTSNSSVITSGNNVKISSVNSSSITLSSNALSTNGAFNLYFGNPQTAYTAVAFDPASANAFVANLASQIVPNSDAYNFPIDGSFDSDLLYVAKYPGAIGNSLRVSVCDNATSYTSNIALSNSINFSIGSNTATIVGLANNLVAANVQSSISINDQILTGNTSVGYQYLQVTGVSTSGNSTTANVTISFNTPYRLHTAFSSNTIQRYWEFYNVTGAAPGQSPFVAQSGNTAAQDELHVVVVDNGGQFSGTPGTVLEVYRGLSRATNAVNADNTANYYKTVINQASQYIWWANDRLTATSANAMSVSSSTSLAPANMQFNLGSDGYDETTVSLSTLGDAYRYFESAEAVDISIVLQGRPSGSQGATYQLANYIIDNIVSTRKDCIVVISPDKSLVLNNRGSESSNTVAWASSVHNSSYAVLDSGYKYQYDVYNDVYRWIPLNGDVGGLCARTDQTNDAWWSPAGFNRGQIKNFVKLAYNPSKAQRDVLFSAGINPVVSFPGQGTVLYGDKTFQAKPSAFDRINVRRLFIVLEKAISKAAKYSLFEFNDAFTRSQFKNLITPYLRTIQGRRGITDFLVVCDDTNNTPQIIDSNQFVGDIYIKPARSINFIQLNFVAVATGVQFSEVVGNF